MENIKFNLANNISNLRKEKKLTQLELANILNYSDKSISKWENGDACPDIEVIKKLADFFEVSVDYLINDNNNEDKNSIKKPERKFLTNKKLITILSCLIVWIIATTTYALLNIFAKVNYWLCFIWAIPATFIVLIVFNAIWGKKAFSITFTSGLVWSLILAIYLQLLKYNIWVLFLIGAPLQIAIIIWANLSFNKKNRY